MDAYFDFNQELILEDEAVLLRPLQLSDIGHLLPFSLNEPELWQYALVPANGKENLENYIGVAVAARAILTGFPFIVYDKNHPALRRKYSFLRYQLYI